MGKRKVRGRGKQKVKKEMSHAKEASTSAIVKCRHNNFSQTLQDSSFKYGFCMDCRQKLKKRLNLAGKEIGDFLPA